MKGFIDGRGFYTPEDVFLFGHRSIMAEIFKEQAQDPPARSELCAPIVSRLCRQAPADGTVSRLGDLLERRLYFFLLLRGVFRERPAGSVERSQSGLNVGARLQLPVATLMVPFSAASPPSSGVGPNSGVQLRPFQPSPSFP